jgi:hypothetical protein
MSFYIRTGDGPKIGPTVCYEGKVYVFPFDIIVADEHETNNKIIINNITMNNIIIIYTLLFLNGEITKVAPCEAPVSALGFEPETFRSAGQRS